MQIERHDKNGVLELKIAGRLDSFWADHLAADLDECVRGGFHHVRLDMSGVSYMSSAGIRVLLSAHKRLRAISGSLEVADPSPQVKSLLELSGLTGLFGASSGVPGRSVSETDGVERIRIGSCDAQLYRFSHPAGIECRLVGGPSKMERGGWVSSDSQVLRIPKDIFALGVGAFGGGFDETRLRFGEFLAVGGAAAYLPTDGSGSPDYLLASGPYIPEVRVLYALTGASRFPLLVRFDAAAGEREALSLTVLAEAALNIAACKCVAIVIVAESAGLIGAALKRSPALDAPGDLFGYPGIRDRLTFSAERVHKRNSVLAVGLVARESPPALASALRPMSAGGSVAGHFHAAAFAFRAIPNGRIGLDETVAALFEAGAPLGILHLLSDEREISGGGESGFVRGAMWVGAVETGAI